MLMKRNQRRCKLNRIPFPCRSAKAAVRLSFEREDHACSKVLQANHPSCSSRDGSHPTCAHVRERRSCTRNDGLLRGSDTYGDLQNVRRLCRCCHLLWRPNFRRNSDDVGKVPGRYPWTFRCSVWRWSSRLGCRLDWLTHRPVHVRVPCTRPSGENRYQSIRR